ncbi:MAG: SynChlorMet cassette protein ScmC [Chloroflexi bacterium]|nr:SynChlorMet cassette protein ScmC [Chloroflexota bacterium]
MSEAARGRLTLTLADGSAWHIVPGHDEARPVVQALGKIMQLKPLDRSGRFLVVVTRGHDPAVVLPADSGVPVICDVGAGEEIAPDLFPIQVSRLALAIARQTQPRGGMLLHGALAEYIPHLIPSPLPDGGGGGVRSAVLLVGPGTVGKTTASNRLPPPWRSLCDDTTLIVRDARRQYWAHPWPTWSRFYGNGPGGGWDVQRAVPLRAIFFLRQDPVDRIEPLTAGEALAGLAESVPQVAGSMMIHLDEAEERAIRQEWLASASALAPAIPAYRLHISLTGAFWQEIERVLPDLPAPTLSAAPLSTPAEDFSCLTDHGLRIPFTFHASRFTFDVRRLYRPKHEPHPTPA